jgi:hypothetical protein
MTSVIYNKINYSWTIWWNGLPVCSEQQSEVINYHFTVTCERIRWEVGTSHMWHSLVCSQFQWFEEGRMGSSQLLQSHSMAKIRIGTSISQLRWPAQTKTPLIILVMKAIICYHQLLTYLQLNLSGNNCKIMQYTYLKDNYAQSEHP